MSGLWGQSQVNIQTKEGEIEKVVAVISHIPPANIFFKGYSESQTMLKKR